MSILTTVPLSSPFAIDRFKATHIEQNRTDVKAITPFFIALLLLLSIECLIAFTSFQQKLDMMVMNPLPVKLAQMESLGSDPVDILALGSSRMMNDLNVKAFAKALPAPRQIYNGGIPKAGYDWMLIHLKSYIRHYGKPKLLLLETSDFMFNPGFATDSIYYHNLAMQDPKALLDVLRFPVFKMTDREEILFSHISGIHRYREVFQPVTIMKIIMSKFRRSNPSTPKIKDAEMDDLGWQPLVESELGMNPTKLWIKGNDSREFLAILAYCRQINLRVVLVQWPDLQSYHTLSQRSPLSRAYRKAIHEASTRLAVPLIDLGTLPDAHAPGNFADFRHLNPTGATRFSKLLAQRVSELRGTFQ